MPLDAVTGMHTSTTGASSKALTCDVTSRLNTKQGTSAFKTRCDTTDALAARRLAITIPTPAIRKIGRMFAANTSIRSWRDAATFPVYPDQRSVWGGSM